MTTFICFLSTNSFFYVAMTSYLRYQRRTRPSQGFRVELQVSGEGGRVTVKGQDRDKTRKRQEQDRVSN